MSEFLFQYHAVEPTTWVYLSSLLMIGLFFKFSRLWSIRNLDLILLILLAPGLLMIHYGQIEQSKIRAELQTLIDSQKTENPAIENLDSATSPTSNRPDEITSPTSAVNLPKELDSVAAEILAEQLDGDVEVPPDLETPLRIVTPNDLESEPEFSIPGLDLSTVDLQPEHETLIRQYPRWQNIEVGGFVYLFGVGGMWLTRLLLDPTMVRRPLLEPNLSLGGLTFIGCSLLVFLAANVISESEPVEADVARGADYRIARVAPASTKGPGYALLSLVPIGLSKSLAILAQVGIVMGMVLTGYWHFRNVQMGIGAATIYLMLPYTNLLTGRIEHVLPAAFLVWAVLLYRRPMLSAVMLGIASGTVYYPFFLVPLWVGFYWHRGLARFLISYLITISLLALILIWSPNDLWPDLKRMFGLHAPILDDLGGIWNPAAGGVDGSFRLPVLVAFVAMSISLALWPAQKNLGTLMSCSAATMVAAQFWHGFGGGTYMAWYLPLALLTVFRPNLEDRVASSVLG